MASSLPMNGPPPNPVNGPMPGQGGPYGSSPVPFGESGGLPQPPDKGAPDPIKAIVQLGAEIDRAIGQFAHAIHDKRLDQARKLVLAATADFVQKGGNAVTTSPTNPGSPFMGGGFGSGQP